MKLAKLESRVQTLDLRQVRPLDQQRPVGKAWASSSTASSRLRGRALQRRNDRIKTRDKYTCQDCGRITADLQVDHRIPLEDGGSDEDGNLQSLCINGPEGGCHGRKTRQEARQRASISAISQR